MSQEVQSAPHKDDKLSNKRAEVFYKYMYKKEHRQWRRSSVFIVNFEHISHLVLVFLLLTLNKQLPTGFKREIFLAGGYHYDCEKL